ncbi:MAG: M1 family metallopeptidase, partial [Myxococcota bacterium]
MPSPTSAPASKPAAPSIPEGQLGDSVVPQAYRLALTILPSAETFSGRTEIDVRFAEAATQFYMHGLDLNVSSVEIDVKGRVINAAYAQVHPTGVALITAEQGVPAGAATLRFVYTAPFNRKLQGIYRVDEGGASYAFSQFEAISARLAFPSFDEPRFKTRFDLQVTARGDHEVITTTPEVSRVPAGENLVQRNFATTQPLPTYLLAFAVGPLDIVEWTPIPATALRSRPIPLRGAAAKGKGARLKFALKDTAQLVTTLESYFGVAYPYQKLDLIAAPDYAFGAMENVGAIVYREERLLLDEESPLALRRSYLMTHSHELAHQWFGNLVTPKWWTDIWLNESFASWSGNRGVSTARPDEGYQRVTLNRALRTTRADSLASARQIREPVRTNLEIWNAFDQITYRKGGGILAMFEKFLGDEAFRAGVRYHMTKFAHSVADAEDFMASLSAGSQRPEIIPAFRSFVEQPGVPHLDVNVLCSEGQAALEVSQRRYAPLGSTIDVDATWGVPFCFAAFDQKDQREERCQIVDEPKMTLPLKACPSAILPNAGGAGYYHFSLGDGFGELLARFSKLQPT